MSNDKLEVVGAWVAAVGTIIAALSNTPAISGESLYAEKKNDEENDKKKNNIPDTLDFIGNTFQAVGNALEAAGEDTFNLETAGEELQTAGNTTVLYAIDSNFSEEKKIKIIITGNALQAFGGLLAGLEELKDFQDDLYLDVIGNFTQSAGNTLQAVGGILKLQDEEVLGNMVIYSGSWIQSGGAIISAVATMREANKNKNNSQKEKPS